MLAKLLRVFNPRRHFWHSVNFDELAEIYTSMSLRSFGFSIIGIFVPVYLYESGVSISSIFLFYVLFFSLRIPVCYLSAIVIARIGPKHSIVLSTILTIGFLFVLLTFQDYQWPLVFLAVLFTASNGLFFIAYHTDFSKIKKTKEAGRELGMLYIFERLGAVAGPIAGGFLAAWFFPQMAIFVAILVLLISLVPLFFTLEPVKTHQHITFRNFPLKKHFRNYLAIGFFNFDHVSIMALWPLYIASAVAIGSAYSTIGVIVALGIFVSIFGASLIGRMTDSKKGLELAKFGAITSSFSLLMRPFISTIPGAVVVTALSEPFFLAYRMPMTKGFYDSADSEEGYRIVYLTYAEAISAIFKTLFCVVLFVLSYIFDPQEVLRFSFILGSLAGIGAFIQKFPALRL